MIGKANIVLPSTGNGASVSYGAVMVPRVLRLWIIIEGMMNMGRTAIHPGEVLVDELRALGISGAALARQIKVPANRINLITAGKRNISADTALRLGKWFGMSASFWLNLQKNYELRLAEKSLGRALDGIPTREKSDATA